MEKLRTERREHTLLKEIDDSAFKEEIDINLKDKEEKDKRLKETKEKIDKYNSDKESEPNYIELKEAIEKC